MILRNLEYDVREPFWWTDASTQNASRMKTKSLVCPSTDPYKHAPNQTIATIYPYLVNTTTTPWGINWTGVTLSDPLAKAKV